jgi:hypothetical protein
MTQPTPKKSKPRRDFKAWLIHELTKQGAHFSPDPSYLDIQMALATRGFTPTRLAGIERVK